MSPSNIEQEIAEILRKKGVWLRTEQCAKEYAKDDKTKRTSFYRWYRSVEKGKVGNFQVLKFLGNRSFIGFKSANPKIIEDLISEDEKAKLNGQLLHESTKAQAINKPESEAAPTLTDKEIPLLIYAKIRSKKSRVWKEIYDAYMELKQVKLK